MSNTRRGLPLTRSRIEQIFPKLTPAQIGRIATARSHTCDERGEVANEQGDSRSAVLCCYIRRSRDCAPLGADETLITIHGAGQFTGEVGTLSGRRIMFSGACYEAR